MKAWKLPWCAFREPAQPERDEPEGAEVQLLERPVPPADNNGPDSMDEVCWDLRQSLEIDEGTTVPVSLSDRDPAIILEVTQRARELREREKSSVPPVYNFGGESSWSGEW
jgi:hypothetical protein